MADPEKVTRPTTMERREVLGSFVLAGLAPLGFVAGLWPLRGSDATFLAIGLGLALLLGFGAVLKNRIVGGVGATLLFSGPWGGLSILGAPYLALGFLMLFRMSRANSRVTREIRTQRAAARAQAAAAKRGPAASTSSKRVTAPGTQPKRRKR